MGFSRQEYWSGLPFPSPGDLPDPGIEPGSPALQEDALTSEPPMEPSKGSRLSFQVKDLNYKIVPVKVGSRAVVFLHLHLGCPQSKTIELLPVGKDPSSRGCGFSSSHVWTWELNCEESWALKNWRFWTVVLEKTLESPLDCKEIQPVLPKGDQSWVFFGRTDVEAETPILWPPHAKSWLIGKDSDAGRDWGQEEKRTTEDEMAGCHHRLNGHGFEWTPGVGDGQGGLACCDSWGCKESDTTEQLNWTELYSVFF